MEIVRNGHFVDSLPDVPNLQDQCRLCLKASTENRQLFGNGTVITEKLIAVAAVQVEEGDGLPTIICVACNELLEAFYEFRLQIRNSDQKLRQAIKNQEFRNNAIGTNRSEAGSIEAPPTKDISETSKTEQNTATESLYVSRGENEKCVEALGISTEYCDNESKATQENIVDSSSRETDRINKCSESTNGWIKKELELGCDKIKKDPGEGKDSVAKGSCKITSKREQSQEEAKTDEEEKPLSCRTSRVKCAYCVRSFRTRFALQRHSLVHKLKTKLRFVCHVCEKQYSSITSLKDHLAGCGDAQEGARIANDKKKLKFSCKVCAKEFTYQKSFLSHARTHPEYRATQTKAGHWEEKKRTQKTSYKRESEEEKEEELEEEEDDEDRELPMENLQCTQCGKLFATKRNLKRHISTHSGLKYNCMTCGKGFSRADKLKDHEQSKHRLEVFENSDLEDQNGNNDEGKDEIGDRRKKEKHTRPHQCALCPKSFAQAQSLANHLERHKRVKETQKRFLCEVCSKCFAQSGSLVAHMRTHTGVKPYVCNVCSRAFTKSTYLQLHMRTHSGEKPYICQYCSRAFARANTLARHITMHTGEAKYHCQICAKSFRRLTSLNEHTYTHTGQRPYACKICAKRYNNAGSLYAHRKKCKAQQLSSAGFPIASSTDSAIQQTGLQQVLLYSQKRLTDDDTESMEPQFMTATVQTQKAVGSSVEEPLDMEDPLRLPDNVYGINAKQLKNSYYTIYPNM